jgi:NhaP-type Na+/H+ or K+/H+ antiporter
MTPLAAFAAATLIWALVAGKLNRWSVVMPLVMATSGVICAGFVPDVVAHDAQSAAFKRVIEVSLAVILFIDATEISHEWLRKTAHLPLRLLGIALPVGVVFTWALGRLMLDAEVPWLPATLAVLLMVTDSAVCSAVINDRRVPANLRNSLTVESGFNDGLASPFVVLFLSAAVAQTDHVGLGHAFGHAVKEVVIGVAVGVALGWLASIALAEARRRDWTWEPAERIGILALALLSYSVAVAAHGGGFVAAFVTALTAGAVGSGLPDHSLRFAHDTGQLLSAAVWFTFGVLARQTFADGVSWSIVGYAVLVLTVARMVPVALAMLGSRLPFRQVLLLGWLGPRGHATVMFGLVAIGALTTNAERSLVAKVVTVTVGLSLLLHGVTSRGLASWVDPTARRKPPTEPEPTASPI